MFAFGNKHPYHEVVISTQIKSSSPVAIAVHEQRPYVVNASKLSTFCGSMRSGVGIPYEITTKSGKPLAEDMLEIILTAFSKAGVKAIPVTTRSGLSKQAFVDELKKAEAARSIYISILEWKTDTYMNASLYCLLHLEVYDSSGNLIAENSVKSSGDNFGGSFWNPKKAAKKGSLKAMKLKLEALLNEPSVIKAFE